MINPRDGYSNCLIISWFIPSLDTTWVNITRSCALPHIFPLRFEEAPKISGVMRKTMCKSWHTLGLAAFGTSRHPPLLYALVEFHTRMFDCRDMICTWRNDNIMECQRECVCIYIYICICIYIYLSYVHSFWMIHLIRFGIYHKLSRW